MNTPEIIIPFVAGMAGGLIGIYLHGRITKDVKVLLAFSGAYLLALAVMHLLPEIYHHLGNSAGPYILVGFLLQMVMEYFSKGVEHGHIHRSDQESKTFPLGIFLSLFLHSMMEGLPLSGDGHAHHHGHDHNHYDHHNALLIGIAIHKIPEAIALSALLYHYFEKKSKAVWMLALYSLATPLGILLGNTILAGEAVDSVNYSSIVLAIAVGIFLHVSTTIIFEAEDQHRFNWKKTTAILIGLGLVLAL